MDSGICIKCGNPFELTSEEVVWYTEQFGADKLPKRCSVCRKENKRENKRNRIQQLKDKNTRILAKLKEAEDRLKGENTNGISG